MVDYEKLVAAYEVDVQFPDVSGVEHLDMLLTRSEIAGGKQDLTVELQARLAEADAVLLQNAQGFCQSIRSIVDLDVWRRQESVPPDHWWWYLDVLAQVPTYSARKPLPELELA